MSLKTGIVPYKGWSDTYVGCLVVGICFCALFSSSLLTAFSKQLESYFEDGGTFFSTVFSILSFHGVVLLLIFLFLKSQG